MYPLTESVVMLKHYVATATEQSRGLEIPRDVKMDLKNLLKVMIKW